MTSQHSGKQRKELLTLLSVSEIEIYLALAAINQLKQTLSGTQDTGKPLGQGRISGSTKITAISNASDAIRTYQGTLQNILSGFQEELMQTPSEDWDEWVKQRAIRRKTTEQSPNTTEKS